ncbi:Y-family DNA polymerase [Corynebacterium kalidii]|uniref:Y-family DNA polymerase n=1 Tax=Corynebacterium kalidii TaxID=2931982 RepID=UPI0034E1B918
MSVRRVVVLWFPDWPVYTVALRRGWDLLAPAAVVDNHRVHAVNAAARRAGVRQGMKERHAVGTCPSLQVGEVEEAAEAEAHEEVLLALESVAAGVETLRPGLLAFSASSLVRYYGDEATAVELLVDAAARVGADCLAGVADEVVTAVWAARDGRQVPAGGSRDYLAGLPLQVLVAEGSLGVPRDMVSVLSQLGIRTLADFTALPVADVAGRFGQEGVRWHRIACGEPERPVSPERTVIPLEVRVEPEELVADTGTAAFLARQAAVRLHAALVEKGQVCLRLAVRAHLDPPAGYDGPTTVERLWRCREPLTEEDTAQRVRWQLDGWLTRVRATLPGSPESPESPDGVGGISAIDLAPVECVPAGEVADALWGGPDVGIRAARAAAARAQALIGTRGVLRPVHCGGRAVAGRVAAVPYGEQDPEEVDALSTRAWDGELPAPLPALVGAPDTTGDRPRPPGPRHPAASVQLLDAAGGQVWVTGRGMMSAPPVALRWGGAVHRLTGWAGPWPVDEMWWSQSGAARRYARLQVATDGPAAFLLVCRGRSWRIEATY